MIILAAALVTAVLSAQQRRQSKPPTPRARNPQSTGESKAKTAEPQAPIIGSEQSPAVIRILPTTPTQQQATQEQAARQNESIERWTTVGLTFVIAGFTGWLIRVGYLQRSTAEATLATSQAIERAYVSISHTLPGLVVRQAEDGIHRISISIGVTNYGNTPARVLKIELFAHTSVQPLPDIPPYGRPSNEPSTAYLVKNEQTFVNVDFNYPETTWSEIATGQRGLWVLGYVEYLDSFEKKHRTGYARKYLHGNANNLPLEPKPWYNYDIEIDEQGQPKK